MSNLAIIPARSGSKELKDKNIKDLCGHPMLWYSVFAAKKSAIFDEIMVSTDSEKYAEIARSCGANVPFLRSAETSNDNSSTWDVVEEVVKKYREMGKCFRNLMILQPTSPLRDYRDIQKAFKLMEEKKAKSVVSVCETEHSPLWCNILPSNGSMEGFIKKSSLKRRQELPLYYRLNGAIYLLDADLLNCKVNGKFDLYGPASYAYKMTKEHSIDIDNEMDFFLAEVILNHKFI